MLELSHSKLKAIASTTNNNNYGFSLSKNGSTYEFYTPDQKLRDDWVTVLKGVCVLTSFHDEFKALKMIGKGSFAKVLYK